MRRELVVSLVAMTVGPARADTFHALIGVDSYVATEPGYRYDDEADIAWSAHLEWRSAERAAVIDWVERESLIGGAPRRELHEASYVNRSIDHLALTVGRFRVPGGFWLIADGAMIAARWSTVELGVFGGNRSFTNARAETLLIRSPAPLPLVGAALTTKGTVQASLAYTYTEDRISFDRGPDETFTSRQPQQFVDADLVALVGKNGFITAGATAGNQYLVTYDTTPANITANPTLDNVYFGSEAIYAMLDERIGHLRLDTTVAALRTTLGQTTDPTAQLAEVTGSYVESTLRASWRRTGALRLDGRYRIRVWADGGTAQRAQLDGEWRAGWFDLVAQVGVDTHHEKTVDPGYANGSTLIGKLGVGAKLTSTELSVGVAAVDMLADEVDVVDPDANRAPYTLEARSYGFVHAFGVHGGWFAGIDGELDVTGAGVRLLTQLGYGR